MSIVNVANKIFGKCYLPKIKAEWPEVKCPKYLKKKSYADEMSWAEAHGATQNEEGEWCV